MTVTVDDLYGDGTESDPYRITTIEELQAIPDDSDSYFKQTEDIDASETKNWDDRAGFNPIGNHMTEFFSGIYDGNGHIIEGLYIDEDERDVNPEDVTRQDTGLFRINGGILRDIHLRDIFVRNTKFTNPTGGLVGFCSNMDGNKVENAVEKCSITGTVIGGKSVVSGIVGENLHYMEQCYFEGKVENISDDNRAYGITPSTLLIGDQDGPILLDCYANCEVKAGGDGALLTSGYHDEISRCYGVGSIECNRDKSNVDTKSAHGAISTSRDDMNNQDCYAIIEDSEDSSNGGWLSSLFGLGSSSPDVKTTQAIERSDAIGESAVDAFDKFDFDTTWEARSNDFPTLQNVR